MALIGSISRLNITACYAPPPAGANPHRTDHQASTEARAGLKLTCHFLQLNGGGGAVQVRLTSDGRGVAPAAAVHSSIFPPIPEPGVPPTLLPSRISSLHRRSDSFGSSGGLPGAPQGGCGTTPRTPACGASQASSGGSDGGGAGAGDADFAVNSISMALSPAHIC